MVEGAVGQPQAPLNSGVAAELVVILALHLEEALAHPQLGLGANVE